MNGAELDTLRHANDMVNDDCTLVVLQVSEAGEEAPLAEEIASALEEEPPGEAAITPVESGEKNPTHPAGSHPAVQETPLWAPVSEGVTEADLSIDPPVTNERELSAGTTDPDLSLPEVPADVGVAPDPNAEPVSPNSPEDERPQQHVDPSPADKPPASRDGFPESTDPSV